MEIISLGIIVVYLLAMLGVTFYAKRKQEATNAEGFFLASRGINPLLMALTMIAGMQSTFAFLGGPGMYYSHGISYIVIVLSQVWCAFMVIFFGNKIRLLASKYGYLSIGDYFKDRFDTSYLKVLASLISVVFTMVFLAMQFVGNATAISVITGDLIDYNMALMLTLVFALLYVIIGGAGGLVLLDSIQAVILMVGIVLAAYVAIKPLGGMVELFQQTASQAPDLLSRPGPQGLYTNKYWVMQFIVLPFGIWFCPHIWMKSLMAKDKKALAQSAISIPVSQVLIFGVSTLLIGLAANLLLGPSVQPDQVLPIMMIQHSHWFVSALIMAAAISAGMSTINAMLLVISQIVSQDLILFNKKVSDKQNMFISRVVILVLAIIAAFIALRPPEALIQIVQDIAYTGLAQLAPAFILGLYWPKTSKNAANIGMTAGIVILVATRLMNWTPLGYPGFMWAFFINLFLIILLSLNHQPSDYIMKKFFA